jgi:hypothetical protein
MTIEPRTQGRRIGRGNASCGRKAFVTFAIATAVLLDLSTAAGADFTVFGGCTNEFNTVCSEIRVHTFRTSSGGTGVWFLPEVWTDGVLRQGSMVSDASAFRIDELDSRQTPQQYCSWNGITDAGCATRHEFEYPCDVSKFNIRVFASLRATTNLFDTVVLTDHRQNVAYYLNPCTQTLVSAPPN